MKEKTLHKGLRSGTGVHPDPDRQGSSDRKSQDASAPLVSVCMPAYHAGATVREAVTSALLQDVPLEVLILLDDPSDGTKEAIGGLALDPRVRILENKQRLGAAGSRNRAVRAAKGKYIAFLDADDVWAEGKLQKQLAKMKQTGCVLCCSARELMKPDGTLTGRVIPAPEIISYRRLLRHNCINCSSVLVKKEAMLAFPMQHEDSHEDYITWMKMLRRYGSACGVNEPLLKYRLSAAGKSGSKFKSARMTYTAYRYAGFGRAVSALLFVRYALCGVQKYVGSYATAKKERIRQTVHG